MGVSEVSCLNTTRGYSWDHGKALENDWKLVGMGKSLLTDYLKIGLELILRMRKSFKCCFLFIEKYISLW